MDKPEELMGDADKTANQIGVFGQIAVFAIKTCIVVVAISVGSLFVVEAGVDNLQDAAARTISSLRRELPQGPIGGRELGTKIEQELDRAADPSSEMPPEKRQKLLNDVHVIVARWRPFIEAIQSEMEKPASAK
jgi:hypothetical protein